LKSLAQYVSVFGLSFELLKPTKEYNYNCLVYTNDKLIEGKVLFKNWLEIMLVAKQKIPNNKLLKHLNSSLWGSLIAYEKIYIDSSQIQDYDVSYFSQNIDTQYKIIKDHDNKDGSSTHSMIDLNHAYKTNMARLKPFISSFGRRRMLENVMKQNLLDNVISIHTDRFSLSKSFTRPIDSYNYKKATKKSIDQHPIEEKKSTGLIKFYSNTNYVHVCETCSIEYHYKDSSDHVYNC
jgi:hypothetical protein